MNKELMITKEDLVNWLDRPPSNDDLDLIGFITTRLENFYKLQQENKQLKETIDNISSIVEYWGYDKEINDISYFRKAMKSIKEILGDKENE